MIRSEKRLRRHRQLVHKWIEKCALLAHLPWGLFFVMTFTIEWQDTDDPWLVCDAWVWLYCMLSLLAVGVIAWGYLMLLGRLVCRRAALPSRVTGVMVCIFYALAVLLAVRVLIGVPLTFDESCVFVLGTMPIPVLFMSTLHWRRRCMGTVKVAFVRSLTLLLPYMVILGSHVHEWIDSMGVLVVFSVWVGIAGVYALGVKYRGWKLLYRSLFSIIGVSLLLAFIAYRADLMYLYRFFSYAPVLLPLPFMMMYVSRYWRKPENKTTAAVGR